ncbi:acyl-CoA thioester hydrolase/BAAT C-terminal domain-containing protein [Qipengyuania sp. DSG2-2]|uniref:acyl-CoA thioester hydrolase/BAAT C-terminal domain-containing protein n=1 Tax=Qipengyuania sp. DGS2-2 TaxID=3349631 RepID=UPI0036D3D631
MRTRSKIGIGCLGIILALAGVVAWYVFNREPRPIVVAEPGALGERIVMGDVPANFYPGAGGGPRPGILLLGGSEGGLKESRNVLARQLAEQGYSVLYPGYYATSETNRSFHKVPLETFDRSLDWLSTRENIDSARLGVIGHSKGGEAALLVASRHPELRAVIAAMPSDVVWQGFDFDAFDMSQFGSSWTANSEELPYVAYVDLPWSDWMSEGAGALTKMYEESWKARALHPGSSIPVEEIAAPTLLICGGQDTIWPSCTMARAAEDRAQNATLLAYPDAGHWGFGPASELDENDASSLGRMGGTAETDRAAREDQWPQILEFLDAQLDGGEN